MASVDGEDYIVGEYKKDNATPTEIVGGLIVLALIFWVALPHTIAWIVETFGEHAFFALMWVGIIIWCRIVIKRGTW